MSDSYTNLLYHIVFSTKIVVQSLPPSMRFDCTITSEEQFARSVGFPWN